MNKKVLFFLRLVLYQDIKFKFFQIDLPIFRGIFILY